MVPNLEQQILVRENQLSVLVGVGPGPIARAADLMSRDAPVMPGAGLPAALLERRPDIRQAEAAVRAANAQIGAAKADYFPRLALSGSIGLASSSLSTLFSVEALTFALGGALSWLVPVLGGYQVKHRVDAQQAAWIASVASYRMTVLNAIGEVADALSSIQKLGEQRAHLEAAARARAESLRLAKQRFTSGVASYLDVVQAEQNLYPTELQLAQTIGAQFVAVAQLYRALGGGFGGVAGEAR
jgi:multidrug efflux system outer membrane protein